MSEAPGHVRPMALGRAPKPDTTRARMRRYLLIVSPRHPWLYRYLTERFSRDARVEVIIDRRHGERRQGGVRVGPERRHGDRRMRPEVDAELRQRSSAIVIVDDDA